ncbi:FAD-binding oxidoreductase [Kiritimatiella glycovorans]|uniref:D-lactate dehydrogenase (cytochrome) n=1 Tax=Kiritimatiella glycovorans TaxID=1307763 RepID=A0A0G3ED12_9BACT|nr:FAD-binding oxidoreductase [Kiritimatiella glycovorans]AKJ64198.1 putative FAD-linked oxidoreductase [Kiritimatiella glycovorans]
MNADVQSINPDFGDYLRDESRRAGSAESICFAGTEAEVREVLVCSGRVTLQGARTGITAGAVPEGGTILNLSRMNRIGAIKEGRIKVQPGVLLSDLNEDLEREGLFFPPDPTETSASIGGMLACNASGAMSFHYGPTRRWVRALRIVLPGGDTLQLERGQKAEGRRFRLTTESGREIDGELPSLPMPEVKNAAGYYVRPDMDLIDLFIGMEGTLGVITEAELELRAVPAARTALCAFFPDESGALRFVRALRDQLDPVAIEFFGHHALDLLRRARTEHAAFADLPELAPHFNTAIYFEFHGGKEDEVEASVVQAAELIVECGAGEDDCWIAETPRDIAVHKAFRHATPEAVNLLIDERRKAYPSLTKLGTDMAVPDAHLEETLCLYRSDLDGAGLEYVIFGHIGDNHVHVNILPRDPAELEQGKKLYLKWADQVVAMGGSVSAEHGIGKIKVPLLEIMIGQEGIDAMRRLRRIFDPEERLNRGNLFA